MLGQSSGNHDWLLSNASTCVYIPVSIHTQRKRLRLDGNRALDNVFIVCLCCDSVGFVIETLPTPTGRPVLGVTSLGNRTYALCHVSEFLKEIEVYDVDTSMHLLRSLTVREVGSVRDIVACEHNCCVYIPDSSQKSVHRLALLDGTVIQWPVTDVPAGLSLTATHGVLVTCPAVRKIKEFSTDGQLMREVTLPEEVCSPWQSNQLSSGEFIVCHGNLDDPLHRVVLIGSDGSVVRSFGKPAGSGSQQMGVPGHMAVEDDECVIVVDVVVSRVNVCL